MKEEKPALPARTATPKSEQLCKTLTSEALHRVPHRILAQQNFTLRNLARLFAHRHRSPSSRSVVLPFFHFQTCRGLRAHPGAARAQGEKEKKKEGARTFQGCNHREEPTPPIHPRRRRDLIPPDPPSREPGHFHDSRIS